MLNALMSDLRHAVRTLARSPGFTSVALGTLSVGLALCVVVAVLVNAYLVRGLPYPESHRLFDVRYAAPGTPWPVDMEKLDWASLGDVIELPIAWDLDSFNLRGGAYPEALQGTWVTTGYVEGFGVQPAFGRGFLPSDFETGRPNVALISHRLWQSRFGGDPASDRAIVCRLRERSPRRSRGLRGGWCPAGTSLAPERVHGDPRSASRADLSIYRAPARGRASGDRRRSHQCARPHGEQRAARGLACRAASRPMAATFSRFARCCWRWRRPHPWCC